MPAVPHNDSSPFAGRDEARRITLRIRLLKKNARLEKRNATIEDLRTRVGELEEALRGILDDARQMDSLGRAHFGRIMTLAKSALDDE